MPYSSTVFRQYTQLVGLERVGALVVIRRSSDRDLVEVADGIHGLGKPSIRRALGPEERLSVRLRKNAGGADEVPRCKRKARIAVVLLRGDVLHVKEL